MACIWFLVSHLLLLFSACQTTASGHALETASALPEPDLVSILDAVPIGPTPEKRYVVSRSPQSPEETIPQDPATNGTTDNPGTPPANDQTPTDGQNNSTNADTSGDADVDSDPKDPAGDADQTSSDDDYSERGQQAVTNYQPSIAPVENDSDYANYDGQVMNSTAAGDYSNQSQYHIIINADANAGVITLTDEYSNYNTSTMLQCIRLCNDWNQKHDSTVVCQAVSYYGDGECYPLSGISKDDNGRYAYYADGSILGLVLRSPSYPTPSEPKPAPENTDGDEYTSTTTTDLYITTSTPLVTTIGPVYTTNTPTTTMGGNGGVYPPPIVSPVIYSQRTITPTGAYDKTTVEIYYSSCPTKY